MENRDFITLRDAAEWASSYTHKKVTPSNISYLISYGRITKHDDDGVAKVSVHELKGYYDNSALCRNGRKATAFGDDVCWALSFEDVPERDTTKHVHRLHPYKGKYIPQLVEYFIDGHTDDLKHEVYFREGDIILDPFAGSGTTLVQANENGINAIGVDVSCFNAMICNCKVNSVDTKRLDDDMKLITDKLGTFIDENGILWFETEISDALKRFNDEHFPSPEFKRRVYSGEINAPEYGNEMAELFMPTYEKILNKHRLTIGKRHDGSFMDRWYLPTTREEISYLNTLISQVADKHIRDMLSLVLCRTVRSCRSTTHSDLATLKDAVTTPYYCRKHYKICRPQFSILKWWKSYCKDTVRRLDEFSAIRTDTFQTCLIGDSRQVDVFEGVSMIDREFGERLKHEKISGIFTSPPYVGMIDYHEQHAYAYELLGLPRHDNDEIGPLYRGHGEEAKKSYVDGISDVLNNCRKFMKDDFDVFLVANDKYGLYPKIAEKAGMRIVELTKRPVINRAERGDSPYCETIFHLKDCKIL